MRALERQRSFIDFTVASLWRRKGRNAGLVGVYALVVFLLASVVFFASALRREAEAVLDGSPDVLVQRQVAGRFEPAPRALADQLKAVRGVASVEPRLWGYYFAPPAKATFTVMARSEFPHADDEIVVGPAVRRVWKEQDGGLWFKAADGHGVQLRIAAELPAETAIASADLILVSEPTFRMIFGTPEGQVTDFALRVRNERECETIAEKIVRDHPGLRPILREEIRRTYAALLDWRGGFALVLFAGAAAAFLIFAWDKATGLSAAEKTEIGVLKALGWDTGDVLAVKFWEGLVVSLSAFLLGVLGAWIHVHAFGAPLLEQAIKGWSTLYPRFPLSPAVDPYSLASLFFLTVLPYTVITIYPAWRVATTDPDAVMRQSG